MIQNSLNIFYASFILLAIVIVVAVIIIAVTIKTVKDTFKK